MGLAGRLVVIGAVVIGAVICTLVYAHGTVTPDRVFAVFVAWNLMWLAHAGIRKLIPNDPMHRRSLTETAAFAFLNAFIGAGGVYLILLLAGARGFEEPGAALAWFAPFGVTLVVVTFVFEWYGREKRAPSG